MHGRGLDMVHGNQTNERLIPETLYFICYYKALSLTYALGSKISLDFYSLSDEVARARHVDADARLQVPDFKFKSSLLCQSPCW